MINIRTITKEGDCDKTRLMSAHFIITELYNKNLKLKEENKRLKSVLEDVEKVGFAVKCENCHQWILDGYVPVYKRRCGGQWCVKCINKKIIIKMNEKDDKTCLHAAQFIIRELYNQNLKLKEENKRLELTFDDIEKSGFCGEMCKLSSMDIRTQPFMSFLLSRIV